METFATMLISEERRLFWSKRMFNIFWEILNKLYNFNGRAEKEYIYIFLICAALLFYKSEVKIFLTSKIKSFYGTSNFERTPYSQHQTTKSLHLQGASKKWHAIKALANFSHDPNQKPTDS